METAERLIVEIKALLSKTGVHVHDPEQSCRPEASARDRARSRNTTREGSLVENSVERPQEKRVVFGASTTIEQSRKTKEDVTALHTIAGEWPTFGPPQTAAPGELDSKRPIGIMETFRLPLKLDRMNAKAPPPPTPAINRFGVKTELMDMLVGDCTISNPDRPKAPSFVIDFSPDYQVPEVTPCFIDGVDYAKDCNRPLNEKKLKIPCEPKDKLLTQIDSKVLEKITPADDKLTYADNFKVALARLNKNIMISERPEKRSHARQAEKMAQAVASSGLALRSPETPDQTQAEAPGGLVCAAVSSPTQNDLVQQTSQKFSRKIVFGKSCSKFSLALLGDDCKEHASKGNLEEDEESRAHLAQLITKLQLKKLLELMQDKSEQTGVEVKEVDCQTEKKFAAELQDRAVGSEPLEETAECNFAPVYEVHMGEVFEEADEEPRPRVVHANAYASGFRIKDQRHLGELKEQTRQALKKELQKFQMKTLIDKTRESVKAARARHVRSEEAKSAARDKDHLENLNGLGPGGHHSVHLSYCKHFECLAGELPESYRQSLKKERIANLYGSTDEIFEQSEEEYGSCEQVASHSPQLEGDLGKGSAGDFGEPSFQTALPRDTITSKESLERRMEQTLSKIRNVVGELSEPAEATGEDCFDEERPTAPMQRAPYATPTQPINIYSLARVKAEGTEKKKISLRAYLSANRQSADVKTQNLPTRSKAPF